MRLTALNEFDTPVLGEVHAPGYELHLLHGRLISECQAKKAVAKAQQQKKESR